MLPDYLSPKLKIVFVGINPGAYSARVGHYFACKSNMFWYALNQSNLLTETLTANDDAHVLEFGIGLTDLVKRATPTAGQVSRQEFIEGGKILRTKLEPLVPRVICPRWHIPIGMCHLVGLTGYRATYERTARCVRNKRVGGKSYVYLVPSTNPRNARYRNEIAEWFMRLEKFQESV